MLKNKFLWIYCLATYFYFQHALSEKGEEEISKARKPISEKDAEERLSGLNKVLHLCFCGLLTPLMY